MVIFDIYLFFLVWEEDIIDIMKINLVYNVFFLIMEYYLNSIWNWRWGYIYVIVNVFN